MFLSLYTEIQNRLSDLRNERGASAVEYGLLVALIAAVLIGALQALGTSVFDVFEEVTGAITGR